MPREGSGQESVNATGTLSYHQTLSQRSAEAWVAINAVLGGDEYREWGDAAEAAYLLSHEM